MNSSQNEMVVYYLANIKNVDDLVNTNEIKIASKLILNGDLVAFPTETVYGLGASAYNGDAVNKIFIAKSRPNDNPLIVHISSIDQLENIVGQVNDIVLKLANTFWPGPLTFVLPLPSNSKISKVVTCGLNSVAIRMPNHPVALALIRESEPLAAPSANISGFPSPTTYQHVVDDLSSRGVKCCLDGGPTNIGLESTVIDLCHPSQEITILRPGGITKEQIENVLGTQVNIKNNTNVQTQVPICPGLKYTHYSPKARVIIIEGNMEFFQKCIDYCKKMFPNLKVGALISEKSNITSDSNIYFGSFEDLSQVARNLFACLRESDKFNINVLFCPFFSNQGIGSAIMNRLIKAASHRIINVSNFTEISNILK